MGDDCWASRSRAFHNGSGPATRPALQPHGLYILTGTSRKIRKNAKGTAICPPSLALGAAQPVDPVGAPELRVGVLQMLRHHPGANPEEAPDRRPDQPLAQQVQDLLLQRP